MPFTDLADGPNHEVAKLCAQKAKRFIGWMPVLLIIDKEGRIRYSHYGESMSDISSNEKILSLLDGLNTGEGSGKKEGPDNGLHFWVME